MIVAVYAGQTVVDGGGGRRPRWRRCCSPRHGDHRTVGTVASCGCTGCGYGTLRKVINVAVVVLINAVVAVVVVMLSDVRVRGGCV